MPVTTLQEALPALGLPADAPPPQPVLYGSSGCLVTLGFPDTSYRVTYRGFWVDDAGVRVLGAEAVPSAYGTARGLTGPARQLFDLLVEAVRLYYHRVGEIDREVAAIQAKGRPFSLEDAWVFQRQNAVLRTEIGRAIVALSELAGPLSDRFPGFAPSVPSAQAQLTGAREFALGVQAMISDLIQLRSAEESNRLQAVANELTQKANKLAAYTNISNIRVLGITYVALILALVSAVVLIPNTGATILGMPSAAWVPGWLVVVILIILAAVPLALVFSRPWVLRLLRGLMAFEFRAEEGIADLPEITPEESAAVRAARRP